MRHFIRNQPGRQAWVWHALALCVLAITGYTNAATKAKPATRQPNVVVLFPDNMRGQAMGCMGNPNVHTPNIDRLASQGILFPQTFANAPECTLARAIMLTGKYPHINGVVANDLRLRDSQVTIAELLVEEGYRTGFIGKWHLDGGSHLGFTPPGPRRQGFQFWAANEAVHANYRSLYFRDDPTPIPITKYEPEVWTDLAIEFMRGTKKDQPFFLMIGTAPPGPPHKLGGRVAPEKYLNMYDPAALTMRPNFKGVVHPLQAAATLKAIGREMDQYRSFDHVADGAPFTPAGIMQLAHAIQEKGFLEDIQQNGREELAGYYAAITAIDDQVGRLMQTLDELGIAEDTIFVFTSDHGNLMGSHEVSFVMQHMKPWDEVVRVPGIVRYPRKVKAGQQLDTLFSLADLAPSLLALCGTQVPKDMQGTDLSEIILGRETEGPNSVYFSQPTGWQGGKGGEHGGWRGVRTDRYMYVSWPDKPRLLYDMEKDPYQLNSLVGNPEYAAVQKELDQKLQQWMQQTGDSWKYNWTPHEGYEPIQDLGRLYTGHGSKQPFYSVDQYFKWAAENPDLVPKKDPYDLK